MAYANVQKPTKPIIVEKVSTFRRKQSPDEICVVPEIPHNRKLTDVGFIITFGICVAILLSLMIYTLVHSDIQRYIHGYDKCGNVCGFENSIVSGISCSGQDMRLKPFLTYEYDYNYYGYIATQCVQKCNESQVVKFNRCFPYDVDIEFWPDIVDKIQDESVSLTILCIVGLALSIVMVIIFRFYPKQFVWTMLILVILLMFALAGLMWYLYSDSDDEEGKSGLLVAAIIFTIIAVIVALCIMVLKAKINLIIFFYRAALKIVFAMPLILFEPVLTFISNFIVMGIFVYTFVLMMTSGKLEMDDRGRYLYVLDGAMIFAVSFSVIMLIWMLLFVLACQQMVIAGAVATYYFARDKLLVISPIYNSFYNLVRYHLGTAAFGSLILALVSLLKMVIRGLSRQNNWMGLIYFCLRPLEDLVKYMTSMGYIETAIHAQPLCRSSVRALNLIVANLLSAVALNSVGNFTFFMAKLVVVVITVLIGVLMDLSVVTIVFGGLVALVCIHCFFVVFETAVDTIFICYCEDQCINDGDVNPYQASVELHNEIKKAQAISLAELKKNEKNKK